MMKKLMCLAAVLVLVAACDSTPTEDGSGGAAAGGLGGSAGSGVAGVGSKVVPGSQEDLVVNVGDRVFFGFDRSELTPEARATLDRQAAWLNANPSVKVVLEGHCDERGTREYNLALGDRRATSAKNYLVATGVSTDRIRTISYGKERPAVLGSSDSAWAQNRRAVTVVAE